MKPWMLLLVTWVKFLPTRLFPPMRSNTSVNCTSISSLGIPWQMSHCHKSLWVKHWLTLHPHSLLRDCTHLVYACKALTCGFYNTEIPLFHGNLRIQCQCSLSYYHLQLAEDSRSIGWCSSSWVHIWMVRWRVSLGRHGKWVTEWFAYNRLIVALTLTWAFELLLLQHFRKAPVFLPHWL